MLICLVLFPCKLHTPVTPSNLVHDSPEVAERYFALRGEELDGVAGKRIAGGEGSDSSSQVTLRRRPSHAQVHAEARVESGGQRAG